MFVNGFKEKLKSGSEICRILQMKGELDFGEMAACAGFDAILLDCEHSALSVSDVKNFVRTAQCGGAVTLVRTWKNDADLVARYMDAGAVGIVFTDIRSKEDAENAVKAVKYPPLGLRGLSSSRSNGYGFSALLKDHVRQANEATIVALMVENKECIDNLEEIMTVPGVDLLCFGPTDLSNDIGVPGQCNHPEVLKLEDCAYEAARKAGIPMDSIFRPGEMSIEEELAKGRRILTLSLTSAVAAAYRSFIEGTRV